ncbi:High affinity cAMP-specific 3',5'-cyclic phosphodiesterase 7A [Lobulomyces angularis]|nr:High affinity cAMP-specific 3',5'-cyclic phosphodiesterase 7A [Lobulomyces angularis]
MLKTPSTPQQQNSRSGQDISIRARQSLSSQKLPQLPSNQSNNQPSNSNNSSLQQSNHNSYNLFSTTSFSRRPENWTKKNILSQNLLQSNNESGITSDPFSYSFLKNSKQASSNLSQSSFFSNSNKENNQNNFPFKNPQKEDTNSIYSKSMKERIKEFGNPLRGPVVVEMFTHYTYFVIVLAVAWATSWDRNIRLYMGLMYYHVAILTLQLTRIIFSKRPNSVIPVYMSLIPFAALIALSRNTHQIVMILWYISFLLVCLQIGSNSFRKHFILYSILFNSIYLLVCWWMANFYTNDCNSALCGVALKPTINVKYEVVLVLACGIIMGTCMMLEKFIHLNAIALLERENYMRQLYFANIDLKKQLRLDNNKNQVDLEAPLTKATQILKSVKDSGEVDESVSREIELIISLLTSDQLYSPDIYQKPADSEVHGWLNDMLLPNQRNDAAIHTRGIEGAVVNKKNNAIASADDLKNVTHYQEEVQLTQKDRKMFQSMAGIENNPAYDVHEIETNSNGQSLYYFSWFLFRKLGFFKKFKIREEKFLNFLKKIQSGYIKENPYHNSTHATDVTHAMYYYISRKRIWEFLTPEEQIAAIIAPMIHDYAHPGVNNAYLVSVVDPLAIRYSDQSVLENFHCSTVFEIMLQEDYNFLENLTLEERKPIREMVISMVLATDMTFHFEWVGKFKTKMSGNGLNLEQKLDRKLLLNMAIKCADVNNPSKPLEQSKNWTELVMEEFYRQGDREREKGVPISMFYDRNNPDVPKCQIGFIDYIVYPIFETWQMFMEEDVKVHIENVMMNKGYWKKLLDQNLVQKKLESEKQTIPLTQSVIDKSTPDSMKRNLSSREITNEMGSEYHKLNGKSNSENLGSISKLNQKLGSTEHISRLFSKEIINNSSSSVNSASNKFQK